MQITCCADIVAIDCFVNLKRKVNFKLEPILIGYITHRRVETSRKSTGSAARGQERLEVETKPLTATCSGVSLHLRKRLFILPLRP